MTHKHSAFGIAKPSEIIEGRPIRHYQLPLNDPKRIEVFNAEVEEVMAERGVTRNQAKFIVMGRAQRACAR